MTVLDFVGAYVDSAGEYYEVTLLEDGGGLELSLPDGRTLYFPSRRGARFSGPDGVGKVFTISWRSFLPYDLTFVTTVTDIDRPYLMQGRAVGELTGTGRWRLFHHGGVTAVTYEWNVRTTKAWMNVLAPVARPVFEWSHDYVMRRGGAGLKSRLGGL